jgi:hypothetical protein
LAKMKELGEDWWARYRMNLKIHRFPALSRVLTQAVRKDPPVVRRAARSRADPARMFYRVSDVMRIFGAVRQTVLYWAEKGILPAGSLAPRKNRIPASAFAVLKKMYDSSCTAEQARALLGCTKATVRHLARIGAIHNAGFARRQDRLVVESLQALNAQFLACVQKGIPRDCVSFEQVANAVRTREEWTALCTLAQNGAVYSKLPQSARVSDLWFPRAELVACVRGGSRLAKANKRQTSQPRGLQLPTPAIGGKCGHLAVT